VLFAESVNNFFIYSFRIWDICLWYRMYCVRWWCTPVILALQRLRQEDLEFQASLAT
jgi:hypothetical protein